ncbi:MAG: TylF/MycF/NovP-related O-methyltransferase [Geminicoccaceae bacterium]
MGSVVREAAKWALRKGRIDIELPEQALGFEIRRADLVPMVDNTVRRLLYFRRMLDKVKDVPGDVVECGVLYGESLLLLSFLVAEEGRLRKIWGFDSFEPLSSGTEVDQTATPRKLRRLKGTVVSIDSVEKLLKDARLGDEFVSSQVTLVQGYFEQSLEKFAGKSIALLHIDVDLYDSYVTVLKTLTPKMASGGVILFDEYLGTREHAYFPGARKAIDEFFADRKHEISRDAISGKYFITVP